MTYARSRSMNAELNEGATDGKYKKVNPNRSNAEIQWDRDDLKDVWFGIHEAPDKIRPDGKHVSTPAFVHTMPAEPTVG